MDSASWRSPICFIRRALSIYFFTSVAFGFGFLEGRYRCIALFLSLFGALVGLRGQRISAEFFSQCSLGGGFGFGAF